ncbi:putative Nudix hydrolase YvcI [Halolactibacillus miurensis]|uniref:8-oxo-dGTP diphosphatase n=1 Tax=Halolactibacillus miurensis TaxID=306541 RepID=A0A1I6RHX8_9BACI|nr:MULTISPECIES: 8-oxo-dGTP diphosphatase [Halolactibacillus]GEM03909.1 putative Nudix hydrolase YvcI [Halolactibacillus miurensis]SFS64264.1 8-oxo-dGTP diphosphatase [Halolactibacillus miurensis]
MQRVTNCLIIDQDKVLLLKKPRYGWYAMPGGKMEPHETVQEAVIREVYEETGLKITNPKIMSIANINKPSAKPPKDDWMMFTFVVKGYEGTLVEECPEGELEWIDLNDVSIIPTAPSDRIIHDYTLKQDRILYAQFELDEKDQLISFKTQDN